MLAYIAIGIAFTITVGCGGETPLESMQPASDTVVETFSVAKKPLEMAPAAPQLQVPEGTPTIKSIGYYSNWQLTKPLTGTVPVGKTIFIQIVFSEEMQLVVADNKTARPILYYRTAGKLTRFRIAKFGAKGEDFVSGDAKPVKTQATYLCKYVVQPEDKGEFVFAVGKFSTDRQGNTLAAFYTHKEKLHLGQSLPNPGILSLVPTRDSGARGDNVTNHSTVIITGKLAGAPPKEAKVQLYNNGDVIPGAVDITFERKKRWAIVAKLSEGVHTLTARTEKGAESSVETKPFVLTVDTTAPTTATVETHLDGNTLHAEVSGKDIIHYRYAVIVGECDETTHFSDSVSVKTSIAEDIAAFPAGTLSLCIIAEDIAGNQQATPTVVSVEKTTPIVKPIPTQPVETIDIITSRNLADFVGRVYVPTPARHGLSRSEASPIADVAVTIVSGPRSRERVITDQNGQYIFPNVEADELHLLVEKAHFEPKEVIVHRSRPTTLPNRMALNFHGDPQKNPGNILIGHAWPKEVQFILRETLVVNDLLYINGGIPATIGIGGFYGAGVVVVYEAYLVGRHGKAGVLGTVVHEIAHAHQHALTSVDGSGNIWAWKDTPEGKAFAEARQKDWQEVGKADYDTIPGYDTLDENAAETCAHYWSVNRWGGRTAYGRLEVSAPNRFRWAKQWLSR